MNKALVIPALGEGITEGIVAGVPVSTGEYVELGQTLLEVETDKVVIEIPAECSGTIEQVLVGVGDIVAEGGEFAVIAQEAEPKNVTTASTVEDFQQGSKLPSLPDLRLAQRTPFAQPLINIVARNDDAMAPAGPASRRLARELGIDITRVRGSGRRGRISKEDVKVYARQLLVTANFSRMNTVLPDVSVFGPVRREPMTAVQHATSRNMRRASELISHAWLQEKIDITKLQALRQQHKAAAQELGVPLTITAMLCQALASIVRRFPLFNTYLDEASREIIYLEYINIGIAVDTERGLVVPVMRNLEGKSVIIIARELYELSSKARDNRLVGDDMQGAGITLSNLGGIGTSAVFPIVNWPEVAILGVAKSQQELRLVDGEVQPHLIMPVTLGFDHRIINGADGARFLGALRQYLENPESIPLGMELN